MIVTPVIAQKRDALQRLLDSMNTSPGNANPDNHLIPFAQFDELHTARLLIIEAKTGHEIQAYGEQPHDWPPTLAILGDLDGESRRFLAKLAVRANTGLNLLFQHCVGFDAHTGTLLDWLEAHSAKPAASYVNWAGRTVTQIRENAQLARCLSGALPHALKRHGSQQPRALRQALLTHVQTEQHAGRLTLTPVARTTWQYRWRHWIDLIALPLVLILLSPVLILITPWVAWRLRYAEARDPDINDRVDKAHIQQLSRIEDHDVSNQFNVFGDVKPGLFRYLLLAFIMRLVDYVARHIYRRGFLARVRTIHFARWVFLNNNRSMFFASVYDGSLESYMDDFINKVSFGLNLTFSHGVGYPRTRWMIKGGAELEQPFKNTLRRHQLPSAVWYYAHQGLTATDMARHARLRYGINHYPTNDEHIRQWLSEI